MYEVHVVFINNSIWSLTEESKHFYYGKLEKEATNAKYRNHFIEAATKVVNSFGTDVSYSVFINSSCSQNFEDAKWQTNLEREKTVTDWYGTF